jgi:uncharacterized protein YggE
MSIHPFVFTIAFAPGLLLGQLNSNTVTATASQNATSQPDQAIFNVTVGSGTDKSLDDVVKSVASVGISAANLIGVTYQSNPPALNPAVAPAVQWVFELPVALSMQKQTTASLGALQQTIAQGNSGLSLSFSVAGLQSLGQQTQSCNYSTLFANAQAQAQQIASAAGSAAGRITGISGSTSNGVGNCSATVTFGLGYTGSPGPHAISITASRTSTTLPDQILISISVTSGIASGLDDITNALTQAGVTGASFSNVYTAYTYDNKGNQTAYLQWSFTLTTPLTALKNTIQQLLSAEAALSKQKTGISLSFSTSSLQVSPQAQPACSQAALVADATAQAQALAGAAGVSVGTVTAISGAGVTAQLVLVPTLATRSGDFTDVTLTSVAPTPATTCSMLVQFQLY